VQKRATRFPHQSFYDAVRSHKIGIAHLRVPLQGRAEGFRTRTERAIFDIGSPIQRRSEAERSSFQTYGR
jgi:hypothetical protein